MALLGLFVARIALDARCPRGAAISLISLYAAVFFYHRVYDAVILAVPLTYCLGLARNLPARRSRPFAACAAALIATLFMYQRFLVMVEAWSHDVGHWGRFLRAIVLPASTWSILLAIACLGVGVHRQFRPRVEPA